MSRLASGERGVASGVVGSCRDKWRRGQSSVARSRVVTVQLSTFYAPPSQSTVAVVHRDSKNHHLLIQVWKEYVAKHFPQPSAAAVDADSDMFDVITEPQAPPPPSDAEHS